MGALEGGSEKGGRDLRVDGSSRMRVIIMTDVVYSHFHLHHLFCGSGGRSQSSVACRQVLQSLQGWKRLANPLFPSIIQPLFLASQLSVFLFIPSSPSVSVLIWFPMLKLLRLSACVNVKVEIVSKPFTLSSLSLFKFKAGVR